VQPMLQQRLGVTVIVDNRSGASGSVGTAMVAKSPPDGNTWLIVFDNHAANPFVLPNLPFDTEKDLDPVLLIGNAPYLLATSPDKPFKSLADVINAAKAKPNSVSYGSVGSGSIGHLAMVLLGKQAGVSMVHVPYRGGGPAMNDLLGGHVDLLCGSIALVAPQLSGPIRAVAQMGTQRLPLLQDVQTTIEAGFEGFEALAWWGVFAPSATPPETLSRLSAAIREALSEREIATKLQESQQMTLLLGDTAVATPFFAKQTKLWGDVVRENNIKA
jgi:tripartite-type tricarboxylate transporter receptor subunit TctC